jgi:hypothetical protein
MLQNAPKSALKREDLDVYAQLILHRASTTDSLCFAQFDFYYQGDMYQVSAEMKDFIWKNPEHTASLPHGATMTGVTTPNEMSLIKSTNQLIKEYNKSATPIRSPKLDTYMKDALQKKVSENGVDVTIPNTGWFFDEKANVTVSIHILTIEEGNPNLEHPIDKNGQKGTEEDIVLQYSFQGYARIEVTQNGNTYETTVPISGQMNSTVYYKTSKNFTGVPYIPHNIPNPNRKRKKRE